MESSREKGFPGGFFREREASERLWFFVVREGQEAYFCFLKSSERGFEEAIQRLSEVVSGTAAPRWTAVLPEPAEDRVSAKVTCGDGGERHFQRNSVAHRQGPRWASPIRAAWVVFRRFFPTSLWRVMEAS